MATPTTTTTEATASEPTDDPFAGGLDSECSTPFVSAPSSPTRDHAYHGGPCFYSAPASPTRGGAGCLDFDFDFSSRFPSPSAAAMSSADELFCNGQIRPVRLAAALLQPQLLPVSAADNEPDDGEKGSSDAPRGRVRTRLAVRVKARSMSPFRSRWRSSPSPAPAATEQTASVEAVPAASRSSSSSSTASSASSSSSSSRGSRRWGFFKDLLLLNRSKSDGGNSTHHHSRRHHPTSASTAAAPTPTGARPRHAATASAPKTTATTGRRRSAHERLYEARRAEAEDRRRRTYLPYRQGVLLFGCIGLGSRGYGAVSGLARGLNAAAVS